MLSLHRLTYTVRFVQGYRYLDRCGEALIKLENKLRKDWITGEVSPTAGNMVNYKLGMSSQFNSQHLTVRQEEFLAFDLFLEQTCIIHEILLKTLEISEILSPTLQGIFQWGCKDADEAERLLLKLQVAQPTRELVESMGGTPVAVNFALISYDKVTSTETKNARVYDTRKRFEAKSIKQVKRPPFDQRVLGRLPLFSLKDRETIRDLLTVQKAHTEWYPAAVEFDLEHSFDGDVTAGTFSVKHFLEQSRDWLDKQQTTIRNRFKESLK